MEQIKSRSVRVRNVLLVAMLFICVWMAAGYVVADAASTSYEKLTVDPNGTTEKVGAFYFRYDYDNESDVGTWSVSRKKNSGFKTIFKSDMMRHIITNGKKVYYIDYGKLYSYTISTKKTKQLKKLPANEDVSYSVSAAFGKNVYLTRSSFFEWRVDTYMYNTSSKKYKKVKSNYAIKDQYGRNVVGQEEYRSDVSAYPIRVCKLTASGISKGKRLAKAGFSETYVNNKLYYAKSSDQSMKDAVLYRAAANGTKITELGKFSSEEEYGQVIIGNITSKDCTVDKDGKQYKYTYKTKQLTEIE